MAQAVRSAHLVPRLILNQDFQISVNFAYAGGTTLAV